MNQYFTSDWHLGHKNVLKYSKRFEFMTNSEIESVKQIDTQYADDPEKHRKMTRALEICDASVNVMDECIAATINAVVRPKDRLYFLGDVCWYDTPEQLIAWRKKVRCQTINIVWGNHDDTIREWHEAGLLEYTDGGKQCQVFNEAYDMKYLWVGKQTKLVLSHYAMLVWRGNHRGAIQLYGHSHGSLEKYREANFPEAKMLDVGIDYSNTLGRRYAPWSLEEIKEYAKTKKGMAVDHHE